MLIVLLVWNRRAWGLRRARVQTYDHITVTHVCACVCVVGMTRLEHSSGTVAWYKALSVLTYV